MSTTYSVAFLKSCFVFVLLFPWAMLRNSHATLSDSFVLRFQNFCCCCWNTHMISLMSSGQINGCPRKWIKWLI
uniref:Secreted protein n=1 Tax=Cyanoderma ruficeps TaxID=181631 RepID=A0A8C3RBZ9_9PASS